MTILQWLDHIRWCARHLSRAEPSRVARAYGAYRQAHQASTRVALLGLGMGDEDKMVRLAVFAGARDRDENRPMVVVEELLEPKK